MKEAFHTQLKLLKATQIAQEKEINREGGRKCKLQMVKHGEPVARKERAEANQQEESEALEAQAKKGGET